MREGWLWPQARNTYAGRGFGDHRVIIDRIEQSMDNMMLQSASFKRVVRMAMALQ